MDVYVKERICELRRRGESYGQIASALNVSRNTVKSICTRNKQLIEVSTEKTHCCAHCGKVLDKKRSTQRFCSRACRQLWWKEHPERLNRKALYSKVCPYCGKPFISYGNANRKYCSHDCYIKHRFPSAKGGRP